VLLDEYLYLASGFFLSLLTFYMDMYYWHEVYQVERTAEINFDNPRIKDAFYNIVVCTGY
jgi:hypothetical protein